MVQFKRDRGMRYRQIHLDFHTSEKIPEIGKHFSKEQFQEALQAGHVNSITLFSKCHHGWAYHPSRANEMHPGLKFDLLGAQIEAAHEIGVKTPVYLSAGLDEKYAVRHRGNLVRNKDESTAWSPDFMSPGYHKLCMNTPYLEVLLEQIREVCEKYDVDGIFLDIVGVQPCYCERCMNQMLEEGMNPENPADVVNLAERVYLNYTRRVREVVDSVKPGLPVFHNGGHIRRGKRELAYANSHLELESLPTGGWGYDHFPVSASYAQTLDMEFLGMTGKFHLSWGEFGGFKHPHALQYETALSMAFGAKCSIGDQLHPCGEMDMATYSLIGEAYREVEEKEGWLDDMKNTADVAVLGVEVIENYFDGLNFSSGVSSNIGVADAGCARILLEGKYLFQYVDAQEDFSAYKVLILPDQIILDAILAEKIKAFTAQGGKILASGKSGTNGLGQFQLDFGCSWKGENIYRPDYCRPEFALKSLKNAAFLMYSQGYRIHPDEGTVLAWRENPYFNRTREHFSSHVHAPNNPEFREAGIVEGKDGIYIGWNIFQEYAEKGCIAAKQIVCAMLERLLPSPTVKTNLPAQGIITLMEKEGRKILHLLYVSPVKRGENVEIVEDILPVYNIEVEVLCGQDVKNVFLVPQKQKIPFQKITGGIRFCVDRMFCHQMIVIE